MKKEDQQDGVKSQMESFIFRQLINLYVTTH